MVKHQIVLALRGRNQTAVNWAGLAKAKPTKKNDEQKSAQSFLQHLAGANRPFEFTRSLPLCHQRHRSCTDYDLGNNRVKGGFEVNAEKIPIATQLQSKIESV